MSATETRILLHSWHVDNPNHLWRGSVGVKKTKRWWGVLAWGASGSSAPGTPPVERPSFALLTVVQEEEPAEVPSSSSTVWQYAWGGEWSSGGWGSAHSTWCEWSRWWIAWQGASGTWWDNKRQKVELVEQAELVKWQAPVEEREPWSRRLTGALPPRRSLHLDPLQLGQCRSRGSSWCHHQHHHCRWGTGSWTSAKCRFLWRCGSRS